MYKVDYLSYHIQRADNLEQLVKAIRNKFIRSPCGELYNFEILMEQLLTFLLSGDINSCTTLCGFRAKACELYLAKNYHLPIPEELNLEIRNALGKYYWSRVE
jgi:hypothetical protein